MAKRIIKPDSGNTLVLQEDNGSIDALTVETNGDVTLGGNLVIPDSGTIGSASTTGAITIDSSGHVVTPYQSAFSATPITQSNVTGDSTAYVFTGVSTWTEIFDQNNDFSDGTFTAPVTGKYLFTVRLPIAGMTASHTICIAYLKTSNRDYIWTMNPSSYFQTSLGGFTISFSQIADMVAWDTAYLQIQVFGGSKIVDMTSSYGNGAFTGMLLG